MRAGKLTHTIAIEREVETVKLSGHVTRIWATIATMRAELKQASATEFLTGFGEADPKSAVFVIRWVPGVGLITADTIIGDDTMIGGGSITTADRILHNGKAWNIKAIAEIGRRRGLELRAEVAT